MGLTKAATVKLMLRLPIGGRSTNPQKCYGLGGRPDQFTSILRYVELG